MLSVEHVRVRRDGERLVLVELSSRARRRALEIAAQYLDVANVQVGASRDDLEKNFELIELRPSERRLAEGLKKLIEDASEFEQESALEPSELRRSVFLRAAEARRTAAPERPFQREIVLEAVAREASITTQSVEASLYADLRGAHRMRRAPVLDAEALVTAYERGQVQALLLRAVSVVAVVHCSSQDAYRALFQKLKFRKLLYRLERLDDGGYRIVIDGPFSLFEAVTKYGLELALTLPALEACDVLELSAKVLWGKARSPHNFEHRHVTTRRNEGGALDVRDDVSALLADFRALGSSWQCAPAQEILDVPGFGACVPDLVFERAGCEPIYLELLGYWSRDAVWRRLEFVERGLGARVVFAASSKLRVSESVLESDEAALYVFRGRPSAKAIETKLADLTNKRARAPSLGAKSR